MEYALLAAAGGLAGIMGGMLGIGGSVIMLPAMVWLMGARDARGVEMIHQYMAAALIVNFLLILPSVVAHARKGAIWTGVWIWLAMGAVAGVVAGVELSWLFSGEAARYLRWGLGGFFGYVALFNAWRMVKPPRLEGLAREQVEQGPAWRPAACGAVIGAVAGISGVGGGAVAVPIQQMVLRMPLRNAIATSAAMIAALAPVGALVKNLQLGDHGSGVRSLLLAAALSPTAMIGSYAGAHLTHAMPLRFVRGAFVVLMGAAVWKMLAG
jgi:uncharacterized membrane protein YfcA